MTDQQYEDIKALVAATLESAGTKAEVVRQLHSEAGWSLRDAVFFADKAIADLAAAGHAQAARLVRATELNAA